ncbi:cupin domain-containing protein [Novosphingobium panipatense]|uniref:cupin domain-containing protein n=1 Tax=Novosphingobium TaxID=165696 RepID=UPI000CDA39AD|nr:cupin domain-containing protein [Novosphingobium sp. HII-3]
MKRVLPLLVALAASGACAPDRPNSAPPPVSPLSPAADAFRVLHMYGGADGESHLEIKALPRTGGVPGRSVQTRLYATDVEIGDALPGDFIDYHGVSTPRFLIVLAGQLEVGLGDGSRHILSKGDIVLANDVTGRGHTSRVIGTEPVRILTVRLPRSNSFAPKLSSCPDGMPSEQCVSARLGGQPATNTAPAGHK